MAFIVLNVVLPAPSFLQVRPRGNLCRVNIGDFNDRSHRWRAIPRCYECVLWIHVVLHLRDVLTSLSQATLTLPKVLDIHTPPYVVSNVSVNYYYCQSNNFVILHFNCIF